MKDSGIGARAPFLLHLTCTYNLAGRRRELYVQCCTAQELCAVGMSRLIYVNYYHDFFTCQKKKGMVLYPPEPPHTEIYNRPKSQNTYNS